MNFLHEKIAELLHKGNANNLIVYDSASRDECTQRLLLLMNAIAARSLNFAIRYFVSSRECSIPGYNYIVYNELGDLAARAKVDLPNIKQWVIMGVGPNEEVLLGAF